MDHRDTITLKPFLGSKSMSLNTQISADIKLVLYYTVNPRLQDNEVHVVFLLGSHAIVKSMN